MKTTITTQAKIIKEQKNVELALLKEAKKRIKEKDVSGAFELLKSYTMIKHSDKQ